MSRFVPEEWIAWWLSLRVLSRSATNNQVSARKHIAGWIVPIGVGFLVGLVCLDGASNGVVGALLTVFTVIGGFVVTLMLFSGRLPGAESLTFEQADRFYVPKVYYLLLSQTITFFSSLVAVILAIAWFLVADGLLRDVFFVTLTSMAAFGITRAALLPAQIFELHHFSLRSLLEAKQYEPDPVHYEAETLRLLRRIASELEGRDRRVD